MALEKSLALLCALIYACTAYRQGQETAQLSTELDLAEDGLETNSNSSRAYREVYVMLPLDIVKNDGYLRDSGNLYWKLEKVKNAGADGFMVDVWWGVTEPQSKVYNFNAYQEILGMAEKLGLKVQLVTSFHQCGGNVGDTCDIPLPSFVKQNQGIWYKDIHGNENKEYISLFADDIKLQDGRTPTEMYSDWMAKLAETFESKLGNTITEIQVGMGPAGELRYPSYVFANGWDYCGIGEFQAWDEHALESLRRAGEKKAWQQPTKPPGDAGSYKSRPDDRGVRFFREASSGEPGYKSEFGEFFLDWYSGALKGHAAKVLSKAASTFKGKVALAGKVAGIHWWYGSSSHAAELTAGYYNVKWDGKERNGYWEIAKVFRENGNAAMDFTCLEMKNPQYGEEDKCKSRPEDLVGQIIDAAQSNQITFNGENALPTYDWAKYDMILKKKPSIHAFTYLRLGDEMLRDGQEGMGNFKYFVQKMHR